MMLARRHNLLAALFAGLTLVVGAPLTAQRPAGDSAAKAWRTQLELGFTGSSGNSSLSSLQTGISVQRLETERIGFEVSVNYRYGKSEETVVADLFRTELKFDILPEARLSSFLFASATRDPVRRLNLRANGGAGGKYTLWRGGRSRSSVSAAAIFNYEDFKAADGQDPPPTERTVRWSARYKLNLDLGAGATIEHITIYQPVWDMPDDFYLSMANTFQTELGGGLALLVKHEYQHDESPPEGVVEDDQFLSVGFSYVF